MFTRADLELLNMLVLDETAIAFLEMCEVEGGEFAEVARSLVIQSPCLGKGYVISVTLSHDEGWVLRTKTRWTDKVLEARALIRAPTTSRNLLYAVGRGLGQLDQRIAVWVQLRRRYEEVEVNKLRRSAKSLFF
jgi:hypothetical protein